MNKLLRITCLLLCLLQLNSIAQCLSGTYTIGGTTPAYATFTAAINELTTKGICGPVLFKVRPGKYTEQFSIPQVNGSSAINTITFTAENGDSSSVELTFEGTASNAYTVKLDGADYVQFSKMSLANTSTSYLPILYITNNADNTTISNCSFTATTYSPNSTGSAHIYADQPTCDSILVQNSVFKGQATAIYLTGTTEGFFGARIKNNLFLVKGNAIYSRVAGVTITNNVFTTSTVQVGYTTQRFVISNNRFNNLIAQYAIILNTCNAAVSQEPLISNNFISSSSGLTAFYFTNCKNMNIYHNTVSLSGTVFSLPFWLSDNLSGINIKNNILINTYTYGSIYSMTTHAGIVSDANILYATGKIIASEYNTTSTYYYTYDDLVKGTGFDYHSTTMSPALVSATDLHITSSNLPTAYCAYYPEVATDIDGDARDTNHPYYGADEFADLSYALDGTITSITSPSGTSICVGSTPVPVKINFKNTGTSPITKATFRLFINEVEQPANAWSGNLASNDTLSWILHPNYKFVQGQSYKIRAVVGTINQANDQFTLNDTLTSQTDFTTTMSGVYTIGGTAPDFVDLKTAVAALQTRGICGPLTFSIRAGTYEGTITLPAIAGSSSVNTIVFQSESGKNTDVKIISYQLNSTPTFTLQGISNVTFNNLSVSSGPDGIGFYMYNSGGSNITIRNCVITASGINVYVDGNSGSTTNVKILNCTLSSRSNLGAINLKVSHNYTVSGNTFTNCLRPMLIGFSDTLLIENNVIYNSGEKYGQSVHLTQLRNLIFRNNKFFNSKTVSENASPIIEITSVTIGTNIFANNVINQPASSLTTATYALNVNSCAGIFFYHNTINTFNTNAGSAAIYLQSTSVNNTLKNNIFSNQGGGYAIINDNFDTFRNSSNNNGLYTRNGAYLGKAIYTNCNTLDSWKRITGVDSNSVSADPFFASENDLHSFESSLKESGANIGTILPTDADGQTRNTLKPDIGAYRVTLYNLDAAVSGFQNNKTICEGNIPVVVKIKNNGATTLTSATINWSVNGAAQPVFNWTGSLSAGASGWVTLGTSNFLTNTSYKLIAWSTKPNGAQDQLVKNDTSSVFYAKPAMQGLYTVGGASPNFATLSDAVKTLNNTGICGPVTFSIRNGVYRGKFLLNEILGSSQINTITFKSESNDSSKVVIQCDSASQEYLLKLDHTHDLMLSKLTFQPNDTTCKHAIRMGENCRNITISNCRFIGSGVNNYDTFIYAYADNSLSRNVVYNVKVINNIFDKSKFQLYFSSTLLRDSALYIANNKFLNYKTGAVTVNFATHLTITGNEFLSDNPASGAISITDETGKLLIEKNKISGAQRGVSIGNYLPVSPDKGTIVNNMINGSGTSGLAISTSSDLNVLHNTIHINSASPAVTFDLQNTQTINCYNNIFSNVGGGFSIRSERVFNFLANKNDYYATGMQLAYWAGNCQRLKDLKNKNKSDLNSVSVNPQYMTVSDVHINANPALSTEGEKNVGVLTDIDGDTRKSPPDIGADEFIATAYATDAAIVDVFVAAPVCLDSSHVAVQLKNYGSTDLNNATIKLSVNDHLLTAYNWNGKLTSRSTIDSLYLGKFLIKNPVNVIKIWTEAPNGGGDQYPVNDTTKMTLSGITLRGTYTLGGNQADFPTFKSAGDYLSKYGICGPVVMKVNDGVYDEALEIYYVPGHSATAPITIESASGDSSKVTIVNSTKTGLNINSFGDVKIRKIGFSNKSTTVNYPSVSTKTTTVSIENCMFTMLNATSNAIKGSLITAPGSITIKNNYFLLQQPAEGAAAIYIENTNSAVVFANLIQGNVFKGFSRAISATTVNPLKITGNTISNDNAAASLGIYGVYVEKAGNDFELSNNRISGAYGIAIHLARAAADATAKRVVKNNFINVQGTGILLSESVNFNVYFNSIRINGVAANSALYLYNAQKINIRNNIVSAGNLSRVLLARGTLLDNVMDYNNYYTPADTLANINDTYYMNLYQLQSGTSQEVHTLSYRPHFVSATDLHINNDLNLTNKGIAIAGITEDIDGETRSATPDMGADEYTAIPLPDDAALTSIDTLKFCDGAASDVHVKLTNRGTNALTKATIQFAVDNVLQPAYNWTGNLLQDSTTDVMIGKVTADYSRQFKIVAYSSLPNAVNDLNAFNDTAKSRTLGAALHGNYTVGASANFSTLTNVFKSLNNYGVCGPVVISIKDGVYNEKLKLLAIKGSSAINTITFQSASRNSGAVVINSNVDTTLKIKDADNILFKNLTFKTSTVNNQSSGSLIYLDGNSDNLRFDSIHFVGSKVKTSFNCINNNVVFFKCFIESTLYIANNATKKGKYLSIRNCDFYTNDAIAITGIDSVDIVNNRFKSDATTALAASCGISVGGCTGLEIVKNYIEGQYETGIRISNIKGYASRPSMVVNNSIAGGSLNSYDLVCGSCSYVNILYNSMLSTLASPLNYFGIQLMGGSNNQFKNNILAVSALTKVLYMDTPSAFVSDNNVFYAPLANPFLYSSTQGTFAQYQTATGQDAHSTFADPAYLSVTDLHYKNAALNGLATPIAGITDDIQSKLRDATHPNPGAFEVAADSVFDYTSKDLAVSFNDTLEIGSNTVSVSFLNAAVFNLDPYHIYRGTVDTIDLFYKFENNAMVKEQWTGKLALKEKARFTFQTKLDIVRGKSYYITVGAKLHSSTLKDVKIENDTLRSLANVKMGGVYTVGGTSPDFIVADSAMTTLRRCHEYAPVTFVFRTGHYSLKDGSGKDSLKMISETGVNTDVEIEMNKIEASNLTIKKMSLLSYSTNAMYLRASGNNFAIDSCIIKGISNAGTYTDGLLIESGDCKVTHTTFKDLGNAVFYQPFNTTDIFSTGNDISYNTFENVETALKFDNKYMPATPPDRIQFHHNEIRNANNGIDITGTKDILLRVYNNKITNIKNCAISIHDHSNSAIQFYNNFISGGAVTPITYNGTNGNWKGAYLNTINVKKSNNHEFINNSIYGSLINDQSSYTTFTNNSVFSDTLLTIVTSSVADFVADYNNLYTSRNDLAYIINTKVLTHLDSLKKLETKYNQNSISYNPYYVNFNDLHSNSRFLKNAAIPHALVKADFDDQNRNTTRPDIGADEIDLIQEVVWPGDADNDSKVSNTDLLSIGLYNGSTGIVRAQTGNVWKPYASMDWTSTQINGVNYKFADCNGDGVINDNDTLAILQNFGLTHNSNQRIYELPEVNTFGNDLYFKMKDPKPVYTPGERIDAEIWLGRPVAECSNFYGISFDVAVYAAAVKAGSFKMQVSGDWITTGKNMYRLGITDDKKGAGYVALVKKDHISTSGYGKVADLSFVYTGNAPQNGIPLNFENVLAIDNSGSKLTITEHDNNANHFKDIDISTGIDHTTDKQIALSISPNPVTQSAVIHYHLIADRFVKMELFNNIGQHIRTLVNDKHAAGNYTLTINAVEELSNGVYFIKLSAGDQREMFKMVVAN